MLTYIVDGFSFDFADVVRPRRRLLDHLHCDWGENSVFTPLSWEVASLGLGIEASILATSKAVASAVWLEESATVVVAELKASIAVLAIDDQSVASAVIRLYLPRKTALDCNGEMSI